jgi:hypothetical protein
VARGGVGNAQISRRFGDFRRDSLNNRTGNFWRENREIIFDNREFCPIWTTKLLPVTSLLKSIRPACFGSRSYPRWPLPCATMTSGLQGELPRHQQTANGKNAARIETAQCIATCRPLGQVGQHPIISITSRSLQFVPLGYRRGGKNRWRHTRADVRYAAHFGLNSDIAQGPKRCHKATFQGR